MRLARYFIIATLGVLGCADVEESDKGDHSDDQSDDPEPDRVSGTWVNAPGSDGIGRFLLGVDDGLHVAFGDAAPMQLSRAGTGFRAGACELVVQGELCDIDCDEITSVGLSSKAPAACRGAVLGEYRRVAGRYAKEFAQMRIDEEDAGKLRLLYAFPPISFEISVSSLGDDATKHTPGRFTGTATGTIEGSDVVRTCDVEVVASSDAVDIRGCKAIADAPASEFRNEAERSFFLGVLGTYAAQRD